MNFVFLSGKGGFSLHSALVGCTGFVGGNLAASHPFEGQYHSTDIKNAFGTKPQLLVYAGLPAAKYLANTDPEADWAVCRSAAENIRAIQPDKLVLISTVDVFSDSRGADEDAPSDLENPQAYGRNRAKLEQLVRTDFPNALIVRLPALYGLGLKKNFLFDLHTITPAMLRADKYQELAAQNALVRESYEPGANGFYRLSQKADRTALRVFFAANDFNALSFTDSRSRYQFYPLFRLWQDICTALDAGLTLLHPATPPVSAAEIYTAVTGKSNWENLLFPPPADYDLHTRHAALFGGAGNYLCTKGAELMDIVKFMHNWKVG